MVWMVAISKPAKESYAAQQLQNQGCEIYLPYCLRDHDGRTNTKGKSNYEPIISRYFLFRANGLPIRTVLSTRGIHSIVKQGDGGPAVVTDQEYARWVSWTSVVHDFRKKAAQYVIGQQLKIEEGPFANLLGNILEISGSKLKIEHEWTDEANNKKTLKFTVDSSITSPA